MDIHIGFWIAFIVIIVTLLTLDLGVFHRESHQVSVREAAIWSVVWISLALLYNLAVYWFLGADQALAFLAGYLLEKSLSVDNIFVFVLIFSYFRVAPAYQHRVLFWGILTALILRGVMIVLGAALISRFEFLITIFGAFLIYTAYKMATEGEREIDIESNPLVNLLRRFMPITDGYRAEHFTVIEAGRRMATPLLVVLLIVESTDVVFAVDSIPAIFGITTDPFIVFTSNIFAILGLRSLYFMLAAAADRFKYLKFGLAAVLVLIGVKIIWNFLLSKELKLVPYLEPHWSLIATLVLLGGAILVSLVRTAKPAH